MARLVVLTEGYTGRAYELKAEKTTIGRVEDNAFQIPDPSVSSHHCEIILQGEQVLVRDLNSTNGSFIGGEQITESILKQGQILRLGQVDVRLEATPAPTGNTGKKVIDKTQIIPQGVKMGELETSGQTVMINKETFKKKSNKANKVTIAIGVVLAIVIIGLIIYAISIVKNPSAGGGGGSGSPPAETAK